MHYYHANSLLAPTLVSVAVVIPRENLTQQYGNSLHLIGQLIMARPKRLEMEPAADDEFASHSTALKAHPFDCPSLSLTDL